jgi:predicted lipoprotein with Yx(FWY)xxD motif
MKRLALVLLAVLAFTACSEDQPAVSPTSPSPTLSSPSPTPTTQATGTITVASSSLGNIVVDAEGRTLYLFMQDTGGTSTCTGGCASTWPPLVVTGAPQAGAGVTASLLGTTQRSDGSTQVTYNGHPLYHYALDASPGDTKGQGIGGNWFVVSPSGEAIQS